MFLMHIFGRLIKEGYGSFVELVTGRCSRELICEFASTVFHVVNRSGNKVRDQDTLDYIQKVRRCQDIYLGEFQSARGSFAWSLLQAIVFSSCSSFIHSPTRLSNLWL